MSEPALPDKVLALHGALAAAGVGHAFGGALALAYYAEPRATIDIDLNVFVPPSASACASVERALAPLGVATIDPALAERDGQYRTWWGRTPIDLFFAYDELHEQMRREARLVPFGEQRIPVLAPEHLVVCKCVFDRPKDWLDIEQILVGVTDLDTRRIEVALERLLGRDDPRRRRFAQMLDSAR